MVMKKILFGAGLLSLVFLVATVQAQVNLDIHIGDRPATQPPPPVYVEPPPVMVETPPEMIYLEGIRVYVAVGIPLDIFSYNNVYYYHANSGWYRSAYYRGPWAPMDYRRIPPGLRKHRIEEIREMREHTWKDYREHSEHYRGKHFRAEEHHERGEKHGRKEGHGKRDRDDR